MSQLFDSSTSPQVVSAPPHRLEEQGSPSQPRPVMQCWGHELKVLQGHPGSHPLCEPCISPRSTHLKNKFCTRCQQEGLLVPVTHIRALTPELEKMFNGNSTTAGFWAWGLDMSDILMRYRLINQTMRCKAPRLAVFSEPAPQLSAGMEWGTIPMEWISSEGTIRINIANGTLSPVVLKYSRRRAAEGPEDLLRRRALADLLRSRDLVAPPHAAYTNDGTLRSAKAMRLGTLMEPQRCVGAPYLVSFPTSAASDKIVLLERLGAVLPREEAGRAELTERHAGQVVDDERTFQWRERVLAAAMASVPFQRAQKRRLHVLGGAGVG